MRVYFQIEIRVPTYMRAQSVKNSMSNDIHDLTFNLHLPEVFVVRYMGGTILPLCVLREHMKNHQAMKNHKN
jgi:hypothetical protein